MKNNTFYTKIISALPRFATQDKMIEYLRQFNFGFVEMDVFLEKHPEYPFSVKDSKNSIMVRMLKPGKWDHRMLVCVRLWGKKTPRIGVYLNGKFHMRLTKIWKDDHDINFKKLIIKLKFPEGLNYEERKKWRYEDKKVQTKPGYKPTAFYETWKDQVIRL